MIARDEVLQRCLEGIEGGKTIDECLKTYPDDALQIRPLLDVAQRLREAPAVRPSASFQSAARLRMIDSMRGRRRVAERTSAWPLASLARWRGWSVSLRTAAAALVALVFVACGGAVVASTATPDSPLYTTKLVLENARVALSWTAAERADLHLAMADRRLSELLSADGELAPDGLDLLLGSYQTAVRMAVRETMGLRDAGVRSAGLDSRLAEQERRLELALAGLGYGHADTAAAFERALGVLERARLELRSGNGAGRSSPPGTASPAPTAAGKSPAVVIPPSPSISPVPGSNQPGPSTDRGYPAPTETGQRGAATPNPALVGGEGDRRQQATPTSVPAEPSPVPADSEQAPTAEPSPVEQQPGGAGPGATEQPGPQPEATPGGQDPVQGDPTVGPGDDPGQGPGGDATPPTDPGPKDEDPANRPSSTPARGGNK